MRARAKKSTKTFEAKRKHSASQKRKTDFSQSTSSSIHHILFLQRSIGNQAVQRLFKSGVIQAKLKIGQPGDKYEQEADRVAEQVMRMQQPLELRQPEEGELTQPQLLAKQLTPLIQRQVEEEEAITPLPFRALNIIRQGGVENTFVSTESITLNAQVVGIAADQINWTVHGISTDSGNGNPHTGANQSQFTFTPNPTNRPTTGSRVPNDPIIYRVEARSQDLTANFSLVQDETDIIRQEYIDFGAATTPTRANIVTPTNAAFNVGNYSLIIDCGMNTALTNTRTEFQNLTNPPPAPGTAPSAPGAPPPPPVPVPAITVFSGYRNPRRNVAAGSNFPVGSRHVWGRALDLGVAGANATLWARLRQAGANAGYTSICEDGPIQKPCNDPTVDHVHIQW